MSHPVQEHVFKLPEMMCSTVDVVTCGFIVKDKIKAFIKDTCGHIRLERSQPCRGSGCRYETLSEDTLSFRLGGSYWSASMGTFPGFKMIVDDDLEKNNTNWILRELRITKNSNSVCSVPTPRNPDVSISQEAL